ncbi:MAG TPA: Hsp20/alpha crystallin family protein [Dissulfurispiraceae bacterium]|nr:Hsp20/alpha crystallin family protein [Dissulfurispiraceae bacterium]
MAFKNLVPSGKEPTQEGKAEHPVDLFRDEMNRLFDSFFRGFDVEPFGRKGATFSPKVDVVETDKQIMVTAELPGIDEKDIEVSISRDSLTIKGEKKVEKEDKGKDYYRMERSYGSFSRTVPLPAEIDTEKVDAEFKKGVLAVTLPKSAKAVKSVKKISVTGK